MISILILFAMLIISFIIILYRKKSSYIPVYTNDEHYKPANTNINYALLFTMYNNNRDAIYTDVLNYYVNVLKFPKENLFIVDSAGKGVSEAYVYKSNQLIYNQNDYTDFINSLLPRSGPSKYEIVSLIMASSHFDFSKFSYVIKLTCKYKIPELYTIGDMNSNQDLLLQEKTNLFEKFQNTEILGIKGSKFKDIVNEIIKIPADTLEDVMSEIASYTSRSYFPFFYNIASYIRNDKSMVTVVNYRSIPKIINKIYMNDTGVYPKQNHITRSVHNSWIYLNKDYELRTWNFNQARGYLINNFSSHIIECFDMIRIYKHKRDFFKYCLLYNEGGWYMGWNDRCLVKNLLDDLNYNNKSSLVCFNDRKKHISSNKIKSSFMGTYEKNPILKKLIYYIIYNIRHNSDDYYNNKYLFKLNLSDFLRKENIVKPQGYFRKNFFYNNTGKIVERLQKN